MAAKPKKVVVEETSESIDEQVQAYLKAGGKINQIPTGKSGIQSVAGPKHITLGKKPNR